MEKVVANKVVQRLKPVKPKSKFSQSEFQFNVRTKWKKSRIRGVLIAPKGLRALYRMGRQLVGERLSKNRASLTFWLLKEDLRSGRELAFVKLFSPVQDFQRVPKFVELSALGPVSEVGYEVKDLTKTKTLANRGIGTLLVKRAEVAAREQGIKVLVARVLFDNMESQTILVRNGFQTAHSTDLRTAYIYFYKIL